MTFSQHKATLTDGAIIEYRSIGSGPGLVIVPGTFRTSDNYEPLAQALSHAFTVHIMDRRGRGKSSPQGKNYGIETEVADTCAVLRATKASLLFGHSYGGLIGLQVALSGYPMQKLATYEPAISIDNFISAAFVPELQAALAKGDYPRALNALLKTTGDTPIPEDQLAAFGEAMANNPAWAGMCELLKTTPAEITVAAATDNTYPKYHAISADVLLMYGSESEAIEQKVASLLAQTIPHSTASEMPGVGHNAPDDQAPEQIAEKLKTFFS